MKKCEDCEKCGTAVSKGGRPGIDGVRLAIPVSAQTKGSVMAIAEDQGLTMARWVREVLMGSWDLPEQRFDRVPYAEELAIIHVKLPTFTIMKLKQMSQADRLGPKSRAATVARMKIRETLEKLETGK